jgi:hypothetical protein
MKAILKLERIGEIPSSIRRLMGGGPPMPWVAEITGSHPRFGLHREFLPFNKDFEEANGVGSRGVNAIYVLESGKAYEVFQRTSWKGSRRFFATVSEAGEIVELQDASEALTLATHNWIDDYVRTL